MSNVCRCAHTRADSSHSQLPVIIPAALLVTFDWSSWSTVWLAQGLHRLFTALICDREEKGFLQDCKPHGGGARQVMPCCCASSAGTILAMLVSDCGI